MFWGFVLPLLLMLISNTAILLHFSYKICRTNPNLNKCVYFGTRKHQLSTRFMGKYFTDNTLFLFRSRKTSLTKKMMSSFSLAVMLGLSWVTGYILMITQEKNLKFILSVVFCLLNTTQVG